MIFLFFSIILFHQSIAQSIQLTINDGPIEGYHRASYHGRTFMAFEGIPYAKPPTDGLRFMPPQPIDPWTETLSANQTYECIQCYTTESCFGDEDCLYLNVYIPGETVNPSRNLPVLVHFHGGGFTGGSPSMLAGPSKLMDRDVAYVSVNYRIGPLGFLSLNDSIVPGNFGLKDQALSLGWVQANVAHFGGNPNSVTITGVSAGGASTHFHLFSPLSNGLFNRAFIQSGTALNVWSLNTHNPRFHADPLLTNVDCYLDNSEEILDCLRQVTALELTRKAVELTVFNGFPLPVSPVVETESETAFLVEAPMDQYASLSFTDVPLLVSIVTEEGIIPCGAMVDQLDELNANWNFWAPYLLNYYYLEEEERNSKSAQLKETYFNNSDVTPENFNVLIDVCSDWLFRWPAQNASILHGTLGASNAFYYQMGYGGEDVSELGVGHGADMMFLYDTERPLSDDEVKMKDILLNMLMDFLHYDVPRVPQIDWPNVESFEELPYLMIRHPDDMEIIVENTAK